MGRRAGEELLAALEEDGVDKRCLENTEQGGREWHRFLAHAVLQGFDRS